MNESSKGTAEGGAIIVASPLFGDAPQPGEPWTTWSNGLRPSVNGDKVVWREEPPAHLHVAERVEGRWLVAATHAEMEQFAADAVAAWESDAATAADQILRLPPRFRARALRQIGYGDAQGGVRPLFDSEHVQGDWMPRGGQWVKVVPPGTEGARHCPGHVVTWAEGVKPPPPEAGGMCLDGALRRIRAAAGTPVPAGWRAMSPGAHGDRLGWQAPLSLDRWTAERVWGELCGGPPSALTTVVVRDEHGDGRRWSCATGIGGQLRTWGVHRTRDEAVAAGVERLRDAQDIAWAQARERAGGTLAWTGWGETPPDGWLIALAAGESAWGAPLTPLRPLGAGAAARE